MVWTLRRDGEHIVRRMLNLERPSGKARGRPKAGCGHREDRGVIEEDADRRRKRRVIQCGDSCDEIKCQKKEM